MRELIVEKSSVSGIFSVARRGVARWLPAVARVLLGLVFFGFGLTALLGVMPAPSTPPPDGAMAFGMALMKTGYLFQLLKGTETLVGALLLANRFVPLALALLAPVLVNIVAFHAFLEPDGLPLAIALVAAELYLAWTYRAAYRAMLVARARPAAR